MKPKEQLILVEWLDSKAGGDGWEMRDEISKSPPAKCTTVGFIIDSGPDYLTLAPTVSRTQILGRITIPKCAVIRSKVLTSSFSSDPDAVSKRPPQRSARP